MMFVVSCPTHGTRMLMTRRNVIGFANGLDGPVLRWRCACGHEGFLDRAGSHADDPSVLAVDSADRRSDDSSCQSMACTSVPGRV